MAFIKRVSIVWLGICLAACTTGVWAQDDQDKKGEQGEQKTSQGEQKTTAEEKQAGQEEEKGDDAANSGEAAGATDLPALLQQWADLNQQLDAKRQEFDLAENEIDRAKIRDDYIALNDQAMAHVEKIKSAALAKLTAGDTSQETLELVVGIMINEASFDRDADALEIGHQLIAVGADPKYFEAAAKADRLSPFAQDIFEELKVLQRDAQADDLPRVKLTTTKGEIILELFENEAPQTVANFISLIESGYYDGLTFHRVLEDFMAQGGCNVGDGSGGPGYRIFCECYKPEARKHFTGYLSMANTGQRDSGGAQFFITFSRNDSVTALDGKHTVFGRVIEGMDVVNSLQRVNPQAPNQPTPDKIEKAEVLRKRDHEYVPTKAGN